LNTREGTTHLLHILEKINEFLPKTADIHRYLTEVQLATLREIRDVASKFVGINIDLGVGTEDQKRVLNSVLSRLGTFDFTAGDRLLDIWGRLGDLKSELSGHISTLLDSMDLSRRSIVGGLASIEDKLPSTAEKLLGLAGGDGLLAGLSSLGGALGGGIGALGGAIFGDRKEGTLNAIEENTRFNMLHNLFMLGLGNLYFPKLQHIDDILTSWDGATGIFAQINDALRIDVIDAITRLDDVVRHNLLPVNQDIRALLGGPDTERIAAQPLRVQVILPDGRVLADVMTEALEEQGTF
jgi:hypothetical protein